MIKKKLFIIILGLSIMVLGCGFIFGRVSVGVTNHFETGVVDIALTEYQKIGDVETLWEENPVILPGEVISKIPRIFNDGNDCYVRAKFTFHNTEELSEENVFGIGENWVKADDGYWYYTQILPHGGDVDIFEGLEIPKDFSQEGEDTAFYFEIAVDAIQSKNFTPQFDTAAPWGGVEILECEKEGQYDVSTFKPSDSQTFTVVYQGDVKKLVVSGEDFFANFPFLMPGDVYSDSFTIKNDGKDKINLYFRSETEDASDLLDKIQLKITADFGNLARTTEVFYEGSLRAAELNDDIILGMIPAGEEVTFHFEISVPAELNNMYSLLASNVRWTFSTEEIPASPETGDNTAVGVYQVLMGASLVFIGLLLVAGSKKVKEEKGV